MNKKQRRVRARIGTHFLALARSGDDKRPTPGNLGRLCLVGEASTCSMSADACGLRIRGEWFSAGSTREGAGDRRGSTRLKALFFVTHAFQHFRRTRIFAIGGGRLERSRNVFIRAVDRAVSSSVCLSRRRQRKEWRQVSLLGVGLIEDPAVAMRCCL